MIIIVKMFQGHCKDQIKLSTLHIQILGYIWIFLTEMNLGTLQECPIPGTGQEL